MVMDKWEGGCCLITPVLCAKPGRPKKIPEFNGGKTIMNIVRSTPYPLFSSSFSITYSGYLLCIQSLQLMSAPGPPVQDHQDARGSCCMPSAARRLLAWGFADWSASDSPLLCGVSLLLLAT
jgi:hypothetical protein